MGNLALFKTSTLLTNQHPQHPIRQETKSSTISCFPSVRCKNSANRCFIWERRELQHNPHPSKRKKVILWHGATIKIFKDVANREKKPMKPGSNLAQHGIVQKQELFCLLILRGLTDLPKEFLGFEASKRGSKWRAPHFFVGAHTPPPDQQTATLWASRNLNLKGLTQKPRCYLNSKELQKGHHGNLPDDIDALMKVQGPRKVGLVGFK